MTIENIERRINILEDEVKNFNRLIVKDHEVLVSINDRLGRDTDLLKVLLSQFRLLPIY